MLISIFLVLLYLLMNSIAPHRNHRLTRFSGYDRPFHLKLYQIERSP
ncbi:hypothetical protein QUA58_10485 [Microcoleus sp. N9_A1]